MRWGSSGSCLLVSRFVAIERLLSRHRNARYLEKIGPQVRARHLTIRRRLDLQRPLGGNARGVAISFSVEPCQPLADETLAAPEPEGEFLLGIARLGQVVSELHAPSISSAAHQVNSYASRWV